MTGAAVRATLGRVLVSGAAVRATLAILIGGLALAPAAIGGITPVTGTLAGGLLLLQAASLVALPRAPLPWILAVVACAAALVLVVAPFTGTLGAILPGLLVLGREARPSRSGWGLVAAVLLAGGNVTAGGPAQVLLAALSVALAWSWDPCCGSAWPGAPRRSAGYEPRNGRRSRATCTTS